MTALHGKAVDLVQLQAELIAAEIAVNGLGITDDDLHTYDEAGAPAALPPEAEAVIDAHEPTPAASDAEGLLEMASTIDPGDNTAVAELSVVVQAFAAVAAQKGW